MLWLALLGAQAIFPEHQPYFQDNLDARSKETTEPAVLHSGRPDAPGCPVLDVPGVAKEHGTSFIAPPDMNSCLLRIHVVVGVVVIRVLVEVVAGGNRDVTHLL
jgi:hypothetical protein